MRYSIDLTGAEGLYEISAELWYQPIGYLWASNLKPYDHAAEPRRFNAYYDSMVSTTAILIGAEHTSATETQTEPRVSASGPQPLAVRERT